jgi:hypothetical protein
VPLRRSILATWLALTVVVFAVTDWYGLRGDREPSEAGRYLLERSSPDDRIFVWGQAPRIYLDAERHPASRYIATFPLTGYIFGGPVPGLDTRGRILPEAWENLAKDFKDHPPAYIVDTQVDEAAMFPVHEFPGLARLLADQYVSLTRTAEGQIYKRAEK